MSRPALLSFLAVLALLLTGCDVVGGAAQPSSSQAPVEVSGQAGQEPVLTYEKPLKITSPGTLTVWPGDGPELVEGGPVLLNLYAQDGRDGSVVQSTFTDAPAWHTMSVASLGARLHEALQGSHVGARLLFKDTEKGIPLVLVIDVLPTRASGTAVDAPRDGLPRVTRADDGAPSIDVPVDKPPPSDLVVQPLIRGKGPQIEVGEVVTVRFTGVRWSDGQVFDSTWDTPDGPDAVQSLMIGIGQVIDGWDEGLVEQSVGSQVMLVVPPSLGYGGTTNPLADQTLVYVVDILDAHVQVSDEAPADQPPAPADPSEAPAEQPQGE